MHRFAILVHNGIRFEYHMTVLGNSVPQVRKWFKNFDAPSNTWKFRVSDLGLDDGTRKLITVW